MLSNAAESICALPLDFHIPAPVTVTFVRQSPVNSGLPLGCWDLAAQINRMLGQAPRAQG
jgi:hypothetical protein